MTPAPDATSPASQVGMEGEARNETLIERLDRMGSEASLSESILGLSAECAKAIRDLEAENARLRSARWRYKGTNWVYGTDMPVWASSDDCDEVIEPLYASPQSEPLPGGVGEAVDRLIYFGEALREHHEATLDLQVLAHDCETHHNDIRAVLKALAALSGKEQG